MRGWIQKAINTHRVHVSNLKKQPTWRVEDTASVVKRSIGAVHYDLLIASWLVTHKDDIMKFEHAKDAIAWIKSKQRQLKVRELEDIT